MRLLVLVLFIISLAASVFGQGGLPHAPQGTFVTDWSWSETAIIESKDIGSVDPDEDLSARDRRIRSRQVNKGQIAFGNSLPISRDPFILDPTTREVRTNGYVYKMMVENKGEKKIKLIAWEYTFLDPVTNEVVSRHQFSSKVAIKPGDKRKVSGLSRRRPTMVIRADSTTPPEIEQIIIKRVEFSDGSVWSE